MRSIASFSVRQPVFVNLVTVALLIIGAYSYATMKQEVFPTFPLKILQVLTIYENVSAPEIEREITVPIEENLTDIDEIQHIYSLSTEGYSQMMLELYDWTDDENRVLQDVERGIDLIRSELPVDAEDPVVTSMEWTVPVIIYSLSGDADEARIKAESERLHDRLLEVEGIGRLNLIGIRDREIRVEPDTVLLEGHGVGLTEIVAAIRRKNRDQPSGTVQTAEGEKMVKVRGQVTRAEELREVILRRGENGQVLTLGEVARIEDTYEEAERYPRIDGRRGALIQIEKTADGNAIAIKAQAQEIVADFEKTLPEGIEIVTYMDTTKYIEARVDTMHRSFLVGLALVVVVLCLFLNWRIALLTALGIPFALAFGMLVYRAMGGSANALSLFAVILVLGMLVDDGIIVAENIFRHIEKGVHPIQAAMLGTKEVSSAVGLAVLTTICAFLPLLLVEGRIGNFLAVIPIVACLALAGSLIEVFLILPSHVAEFIPASTGRRKESRRILDFFIRSYVYLLKKVLRTRYLATTATVLLSLATIAFAALYMDKVFITGDYVDFFMVRIECDPKYSLDETEAVTIEVERRLAAGFPEEAIASTVNNVGVIMTDEQVLMKGSYIAYFMVDLEDDYALRHTEEEILQRARESIGEVAGIDKLQIATNRGGPPQRRDVEIRILGPSRAPGGRDEEARRRLIELTDRAVAELEHVPGLSNVSTDHVVGKTELRVEVDEDRATRMGFDVLTLGQEIRTAYEGTIASRMRWGGEEVDVVVRLPEPTRFTLEDLENHVVTSPTGMSAPVGELARLSEHPGESTHLRHDRRPQIMIRADVDKTRTTVLEVDQEAVRRLDPLVAGDSDYGIRYGGGSEDIDLMLRSMGRAGVVAILCIYLILGTLFRSFVQPIVVMFTVPFSLIGVVAGLALAGEPISLMALLGTVALAGIVVNDSLVMVDFMNQSLRSGRSVAYAVIGAARLRFRPVLLTSITTIFGLLPLAVGVTGSEEFLKPAALAILWGILFSTGLTLFIIPAIFLIVHDLQRLLGIDAIGRDRRIEEQLRALEEASGPDRGPRPGLPPSAGDRPDRAPGPS